MQKVKCNCLKKIIIKYLSKKYNAKEEIIYVFFEINKIDKTGIINGLRVIIIFLKNDVKN